MHCMGGEDHYRTSVKRNEECRSYRTLEQSLGSGYGPDFRRLNAVTISDVYPLPRIKETQARMEGAAFFSIIQTRLIWSQDTGKFPLGKVIEQKWRLSQRTGNGDGAVFGTRNFAEDGGCGVECDHVVVEWRSPEAVYLGHRQRAVSMNNLRSLVMECPQQTDSRDSSRAELLLVGIVEIPHGFSIQTDELILQASSRHSSSSTRKGNDFLPRLKGVNRAVVTDAQEQESVTSGKSTNSSLHASFEAFLRRIGGSLVSADIFGKTIRALKKDD
ncbi:hypothetical protein OUZ56_024252 [Daphnia magna]|uniref:Uncharacterized protein n=1 Tax=Daphnia magna TaxID=35525 RepID=A0ABR0B0G4_9CRUS|nr:hypothetical protein OUZ56_024252 [Daphnia magna]